MQSPSRRSSRLGRDGGRAETCCRRSDNRGSPIMTGPRKRPSRVRLKETRRSAAFLKTLRRRLSRVGVIRDEKSRLAYDLAHVRWSLKTCERRLVVLSSMTSKNKSRLAALNDIQGELYLHLPYHLKMLRRPLARAIERLEKATDSEAGTRAKRRG